MTNKYISLFITILIFYVICFLTALQPLPQKIKNVPILTATPEIIVITPTPTVTPQITPTVKKVKPAPTAMTSRSGTRNESIGISDTERNLFERLVEAETSDDTNYDNKLGVATVVVNRTSVSWCPKTITGVIYQNNQFSPIRDGHINNKPSQKSKDAVNEILNGYRSFGPEVIYFCDTQISPNNYMTRNCKIVVKLGKHTFFKD